MLPNWTLVIFGLLSMLAFSGRFLIQWIQSERRKVSRVTKTFWKLSIFGNSMLVCHYLIQVQYHLFLIQVLSAVISYRQLSLMKATHKLSLKGMLGILMLTALIATGCFALRAYIEFSAFTWIHMPQFPWDQGTTEPVLFMWHLFGFCGALLFASRFWVQWWFSEKIQKSYLGVTFWWMSLIGALLTLTYALYIKDVITALGYVTGIIPYARNLMLIKKSQKAGIHEKM